MKIFNNKNVFILLMVSMMAILGVFSYYASVSILEGDSIMLFEIMGRDSVFSTMWPFPWKR